MLTRFVRVQLTIFTIASIVGVVVMLGNYLQAPRLLGLGHLTVTLEMPASGGLYKFSNVTYRGVQVGKVTDIKVVDGQHVVATLSLDTSPKIPAHSVARVRSVSAVGEQYVDLAPPDDSAPYLSDGSVLRVSADELPQPAGPVLDRLSALVQSVPKDNIAALLDETSKALTGADYDFGSLLDSSTTLADRFSDAAEPAKSLVDDSVPLLDGQAVSSDALRVWTHHLGGIAAQIAADDQPLRQILHDTPGATNEVTRLFAQIKPTLPVLLANLGTIGQIGVTYNPSIEQVLLLLPPNVSSVQSYLPGNNPTGMAIGDFAVSIGDPPPCTVGFLPPSAWRSPAETTTVDTPDGLYCKLPQDSPIAVRGARNYPCMGHPGKRAPTVEICESDKPYVPLAMRQHALGPYPIDPNLIAQGVPPDSRVDPNGGLFGPLAGTPLPPDSASPGPNTEQPSAPEAPSAPTTPEQMTPAGPELPPPDNAAPSAFEHPSSPQKTSVVAVPYDPHTGAYMAPDGRIYVNANLSSAGGPSSWRDLLTVRG
jgi:phospholipid/cholesterol/gamma-HCH transport system substrate-binding protein